MALAFDAVSNGYSGASGGQLLVSHTVTGSNPVLAVGAYQNISSAFDQVLYNGVPMTLVDAPLQGPAGGYLSTYILKNPATGTHNIEIDSAGANPQIGGIGVSYTGADQTTQPDSHNITSGSSTTPAVSTTIVNNAVTIIDFGLINTGSTYSSNNAGQTTRVTDTGNYPFRASTKDNVSSGSNTTGYTISPSTSWGEASVAIVPSATTVSFNSRRLRMGIG